MFLCVSLHEVPSPDGGRIAVFGDSSCLDSSVHPAANFRHCFGMLRAMLHFTMTLWFLLPSLYQTIRQAQDCNISSQNLLLPHFVSPPLEKKARRGSLVHSSSSCELVQVFQSVAWYAGQVDFSQLLHVLWQRALR
uniref:MBTPS1 fourth domain-containing protein n=1 Tax=Peronospora matthiolae TaxID=2874970 RepID=A0AAV1TYK8_9STRA